MKKLLTLIFVLAITFSLTAFACEEHFEGHHKQQLNQTNGETYFVVNCKQSITLREAPSVDAAEITQIPLGKPVTFIENAGNGFFKVNYDGLIGFALASYLAPAGY